MGRIIIHSDMNSCYASIEMSLNPELKGKAVAVGGSVESRHGIILAKSEKAKKCGVKTGDAIWQAKEKCSDLIVIEPHFDEYLKYSALAHEIYGRYTDKIESMGLDEAWCDLTGSITAFGSVEKIVDEIRESFKNELGITVSVGISFNKVFAKLGSDIAGSDEIYKIDEENFKNQIWGRPVSAMLGVGRQTAKKLNSYGINTIGQLATSDPKWLKLIFGVCGEEIWRFANGYDNSPVAPDGYKTPIKSVGHGATCSADMVNAEEVWLVFLHLAQNVSRRLKKAGLSACAVQITVKDNRLISRQYQCPVAIATQSATELAKTAIKLFMENYNWNYDVRAVTIRAINLQSDSMPLQLDLYNDYGKHERQKIIDDTVMDIRRRFGEDIIFNCSLMKEKKAPSHKNEISTLQKPMYRQL